MAIPGMNILNTALRIIAKQSFDYYAFTGRTTTTIGTLVATYADAVCILGSWQPVDRNLFQNMGLDFQRNYAQVYVPNNIIDVTRDVSGDQFAFQNVRYQCESITPWFGIDGWNRVLVVQVVAPT